MKNASENQLLKVFNKFEKKFREYKKVENPEDLLFTILCESRSVNEITKILKQSSIYMEDEIANKLMEEKLIQNSDPLDKKYTITFEGLIKALALKYSKLPEDQFKNFLAKATEKYQLVVSSPFNTRERVISMALLLLGCYSKDTAVKLDNDINKELLLKVINSLQTLFMKYKIIDKGIRMNLRRKESFESAIISRLYDLPRKSNQLYVNDSKAGIYLAVLDENRLDRKKLGMLLNKILETVSINEDLSLLFKKLQTIMRNNAHNVLRREENFSARNQFISYLENFIAIELTSKKG